MNVLNGLKLLRLRLFKVICFFQVLTKEPPFLNVVLDIPGSLNLMRTDSELKPVLKM